MEQFNLAVTGSIACGKSSVCSILVALGKQRGISISHTDVDTVRAEILEDREIALHRKVQEELVEYFGAEIQNRDGSVNRRRLSDIIFHEPENMEFADSVILPAIGMRLQEMLLRSSGIVLLEWALISEKGCLGLCDFNVLLVTCSREAQLRRLSGGDLPLSDCHLRIESQYTNLEKEENIRAAQRLAGTGELFLFDTTQDPGVSTYEKLLIDICRSSERVKCEPFERV